MHTRWMLEGGDMEAGKKDDVHSYDMLSVSVTSHPRTQLP